MTSETEIAEVFGKYRKIPGYFEKFDHECELHDRDSDEDQLLRSSYWFSIDASLPRTLHHFKSHFSIVREKKHHLLNHPLRIHPFSLFHFYWSCLMIVVFSVGMTYSPFMFLLYMDNNRTGNMYMIVLPKLVGLIDIAVRFNTGYVNRRNMSVS